MSPEKRAQVVLQCAQLEKAKIMSTMAERETKLKFQDPDQIVLVDPNTSLKRKNSFIKEPEYLELQTSQERQRTRINKKLLTQIQQKLDQIEQVAEISPPEQGVLSKASLKKVFKEADPDTSDFLSELIRDVQGSQMKKQKLMQLKEELESLMTKRQRLNQTKAVSYLERIQTSLLSKT